MWFITHATSGESVCFLPEKLKFSVGRLGADVELHDDICVSRAHAAFHLVESDEHFRLELEDLGSKYGTFLNKNIDSNTPIEKGRKIPLKHNDMIRFGRLQNIWKVQFMVIQTVASALTREDNLRLRTYIESLGGRILDQWSPNCTHLTMKEPSITMKLLHALIEQKEIVTLNYWRDLLSAVNNIKFHLPKPESYRPDFGDNNIDFSFKAKRRSLFKGYTFVFLNRKHFDMYSPIVKLAGGASKDLNTGVQKTFLIKEKVVVVQYTPSTQTQSSQTVGTIAEFLESNSKRIIPEYEIGLAILHCSMEKYCNPCFKMSQTMPLTVSNDPANESAQFDLIDKQSTPNLNTESMDLVISETNDNLVTSTPFINPENQNLSPNKDEQSVDNISTTETAFENPRKRKLMSVDLNQSNDQDLFQFQSKKSCNKTYDGKEKTDEGAKEILNKTSNNNVFLQKTQNKTQNSINKTEDQPSTSKETRKRPLINVLNEDDEGNEDDLFSFGDTQKTKKSRQQAVEDSAEGENDLFSFKEPSTNKEPGRTIEVDEDSNDMEPTQQIIVVSKKPPLQMPKPKILPRKISAIEWISSSLGKINIKKENSALTKDENEDGNIIKTESEIKADPDAEITLTEDHRKWLESLKDAIEIQQVSVNNNLKFADKSHYKFKNRSNNTTDNSNETLPNFKRFVKKYHAPLQNSSSAITLHLR